MSRIIPLPVVCFLISGILLLVCLPVAIRAQVEDPGTAELLENFFRDNEQAAESDAQLFLENLQQLRLNPLDLNRATREDLADLQLLTEIQVENLLAYRAACGAFLNIYELQAVPGVELPDIRRILPFVRVETGLDTRNTSLWQGATSGANELILRWGKQYPPNYSGTVEGKPDALAMRYRHSFDNRLWFGITAEKDPGEALFAGSNKQGFDFYSGHLYIRDLNDKVRMLALGDYSARMGQGLLLQTGFAPGKSAEATAIARGGRRLRPYAAFGETYFLRGIAANLNLGRKWECTALFSSRRRDGNLLARTDTTDQEFADQVFTALQTSGYHRTPGEIADEKAIRETVGGLTVARIWKNGQVAVNGLHVRYDRPWEPTEAPYRKFLFAGRSLSGASLDYFWRSRNWFVFGEWAGSENGGTAMVNGLLFNADRHVTLAVLHRGLGRDYQSVYAAPFAETSGANNENGLYIGADVRFGKQWKINAYADVWKHPWLRFGVDAPSRGSEYLGRLIWAPVRGVAMYVLWQQEIKERNATEHPGLEEHKRQRFRIHADYKVSPALELRSRVEWSRFSAGPSPTSGGFLAYQQAVFRPLGFPLTGSVRFTIYDTQDFDSRIYTFENDLFSALSIPAFSGRGSRYFINLSWRVNRWFRLETRFEQTIQRLAVTSSGFTGRRSFWKVQGRFRF
ncbi:MAG: helix-hairpin-helix domain-containing protein [Bacteroidetes bacterium]|nr:MAG: helix-hairpin-helix domain-containing protein [Bacteroidota bacterium]